MSKSPTVSFRLSPEDLRYWNELRKLKGLNSNREIATYLLNQEREVSDPDPLNNTSNEAQGYDQVTCQARFLKENEAYCKLSRSKRPRKLVSPEECKTCLNITLRNTRPKLVEKGEHYMKNVRGRERGFSKGYDPQRGWKI